MTNTKHLHDPNNDDYHRGYKHGYQNMEKKYDKLLADYTLIQERSQLLKTELRSLKDERRR